MDRGTKKAQAVNEEENLETDDEEKISKFYAIIKRFRDARESRRNSLHEPKETSHVQKKAKVQEPVWVPSFEWEDFAVQAFGDANIQVRTDHAKVNSNSTKKGTRKEGGKKKEENGLDLNLTL